MLAMSPDFLITTVIYLLYMVFFKNGRLRSLVPVRIGEDRLFQTGCGMQRAWHRKP
jgi:hypothetical protein